MKIRITGLIFFAIFSLFALWQINDTDPILWISIYGLVAITSLLRVFKIYSRRFTLILTVFLGVYSLFYIPGTLEWLRQPAKGELLGEMLYQKAYIEETREFFGLIIAFLGMLIFYRLK